MVLGSLDNMYTQTLKTGRLDSRMPSHAQNRNRDRANDFKAVGAQVTSIRVAPGNQQIRLCLLHSLAQNLGYVPTANEHIRLGARILLELCHLVGSVPDECLFPLFIDIAAARPPKLHAGSDVSERKTSTKFSGDLGGPRHRQLGTGAEFDRPQDVVDRKLLPRGF